MLKFLLLIGDVALFYLSLYVTLILRYGSRYTTQIDAHLWPFTIVFASWLLVYFIAGLYDNEGAKNTVGFYTRLLTVVAICAVIALFFFYFIPFFDITPRANFFIFFGISSLILFAWRWLYNRLLIVRGFGNNTLIIGATPQAHELYDYLLNNPQLGYNAIGLLDVNDKAALNILERLILQKNARTIVLAPEAYKIPDLINILYGLLRLNMTYYNLAEFFEIVSGRVPLRAIDQSWFLENLSRGTRRGYRVLNRTMDIFFSLFFGAISLIFYPFIIIAIKYSSPGPIFYKHQRVGKAGKPFTLVKFRSMIQDAEAHTGAVWSGGDEDPRITRIGHFMRKTRIDEFPQFWNVLMGHMSFVGPRAERPEFHEQLKKEIPFYEERYLIKPGLTGWAQIKHHYGGSIKGTEEKLQYDLYYIKHRSFILDVSIVLKTINIMFRKAGK